MTQIELSDEEMGILTDLIVHEQEILDSLETSSQEEESQIIEAQSRLEAIMDKFGPK